MISVRLSEEIEKKLYEYSQIKNTTKTEIVAEALSEYFIKNELKEHPYASGKDLFGRYGSNEGTRSSKYKKLIKEKIHDKVSR